MKRLSTRLQRGVAAVEMAFLLLPLLAMTFGMTELGRAFYYYNSLLKSTRDASRHLSMQSRGAGEAAARCLAVYGTSACGADDTPLVPGLTLAMVTITYEAAVPTGSGSVNLVRVSIQGFPYRSLVPFIVDDMTFRPLSSTMRQAAS